MTVPLESPTHWVDCPFGSTHWGRFGAAGVLIIKSVRGGAEVLLQQRALWTHHGGEWSTPGGAIEEGETSLIGAMREAKEETGISARSLLVTGLITHECQCGWRYDVFIATTRKPVRVKRNSESAALKWVRTTRVDRLNLLPAFRVSWDANPYLMNGSVSLR